MTWEIKNRWKIWKLSQHPYRHTLTEFAYSNPSLPDVTNIEDAINWILAVLYPQTQDSVATPADLPTGVDTPNPGDVTPTINDYRVVLDDGDGKAASYRWEQREGDVAAKWYKIYDMDWGEASILSSFLIHTQDIYVNKYGRDDIDDTGALLTGFDAGQSVYGGVAANSHLTLYANSGDGVGAATGFIQFGDQVRPKADATFNLGTATERFLNLYLSNSAVIDTMTIAGGSITDSSGAISFGDENLTTTGTIAANIVNATTSMTAGTLSLSGGSITDSSGSISFGDENLSTTGTIASADITVDSDLVLSSGSITSVSGTISFGDEDLTTTGNITGNVGSFNQLDVDNLRLDGNTLSSTDVNGNINLAPNGAGIIDAQSTLQTLAINTTGTHDITGQLDVDNLRLNGNDISSQDLNGNITLSPNGTGEIVSNALISAGTDNAYSLGKTANRFTSLFLSTSVSDGTDAIAMATLLSFRNALVGATGGESLFYNNGTGLWEASIPDSEVDHTQIANITTGDAGHTQFVMLAGRAGGQDIIGGTAASNNLTLESTSNATKGDILTKDNFLPFTDASYSGGWSGTDLGGSGNNFRDVYTKGEFFGLRLQNSTSGTLPASSGQNVGRLVFATDNGKIYVDDGTAFKVAGVSKFVGDQTFNGTDTTKNVDVSSEIVDARNCIIQLKDNANDFEDLKVTLKATSASNVRIETTIPLPAGTYRLIVME
jgi:hypothetical protein